MSQGRRSYIQRPAGPSPSTSQPAYAAAPVPVFNYNPLSQAMTFAAAQSYGFAQPAMPNMPMYQPAMAMPYAFPNMMQLRQATIFAPNLARYTPDGYAMSATAPRYEEPPVDIYQQDQPAPQAPRRRQALRRTHPAVVTFQQDGMLHVPEDVLGQRPVHRTQEGTPEVHLAWLHIRWRRRRTPEAPNEQALWYCCVACQTGPEEPRGGALLNRSSPVRPPMSSLSLAHVRADP
jgi:hypothetical protein